MRWPRGASSSLVESRVYQLRELDEKFQNWKGEQEKFIAVRKVEKALVAATEKTGPVLLRRHAVAFLHEDDLKMRQGFVFQVHFAGEGRQTPQRRKGGRVVDSLSAF